MNKKRIKTKQSPYLRIRNFTIMNSSKIKRKEDFYTRRYDSIAIEGINMTSVVC